MRADLCLQELRHSTPLVQCVTNYVSMEFMANALIALGASPAMVHANEEVIEFGALARAVLLNIGTLSEPWIQSMEKLAEAARFLDLPCVLDPVGVGATSYRQQACQRLIATGGVKTIRGNASEILSLSRLFQNEGEDAARGRGIDSADSSDSAISAARILSETTQAIVVVTGPTDYVTDGTTVLAIDNGHALLTKITASGCVLGAVIAAFQAVSSAQKQLEAAAMACACYGVCAELAAGQAQTPQRFRLAFIDALYQITPSQLQVLGKIRIL